MIQVSFRRLHPSVGAEVSAMDLRNMSRNLTEIQTTTGADLMRLYRMQNDLAVRVGQVK